MININQSENEAVKYTKGVKKLLKSIVMSYILTLIILLIFSVFITYTSLNESLADIIVACATYISTAACGFFAASNTSKKGWLTGSVAGLAYILILFIIALLKGNYAVGTATIISLTISALTGAIGGVIGINSKKE